MGLGLIDQIYTFEGICLDHFTAPMRSRVLRRRLGRASTRR
jgi:hypothetical protein